MLKKGFKILIDILNSVQMGSQELHHIVDILMVLRALLMFLLGNKLAANKAHLKKEVPNSLELLLNRNTASFLKEIFPI